MSVEKAWPNPNGFETSSLSESVESSAESSELHESSGSLDLSSSLSESSAVSSFVIDNKYDTSKSPKRGVEDVDTGHGAVDTVDGDNGDTGMSSKGISSNIVRWTSLSGSHGLGNDMIAI